MSIKYKLNFIVLVAWSRMPGNTRYDKYKKRVQHQKLRGRRDKDQWSSDEEEDDEVTHLSNFCQFCSYHLCCSCFFPSSSYSHFSSSHSCFYL